MRSSSIQRVAVVGAGPAGSVAAIALRRRGCDVTLFEQARFPRSKVCGECLSAVGVGVLERIGAADPVRAEGVIELRKTIISAGTAESAVLTLPKPMWGISRGRLDAALLRHAADLGTRVLQPARVEELESGVRPTLHWRDLSTNATDQAVFDTVIVADGRSALLGDKPEPTPDFGIKTHYEGANWPADAIGLFGCRGCYGGIAPIEGGRFNIAFSVPRDRLNARRGDVAGVFDELLTENAALAAALRPARRVDEWHASPLPRFPVRHDWPAGVIPVGNAAAALEPIGGEGMGLAMRSAELAAEFVTSAGVKAATLQAEYDRLWRVRRAACRTAAVGISTRGVAPLAATLIGGVPSLGDAALRLVGK